MRDSYSFLRFSFGLFLLLLIPNVIASDGIIDEVVWIVGDEAVLLSEVEEERMHAIYEGQEIKGDPYCYIPEQIAIQKLFLHQADLDSIEVSEASVSMQVEMRMNYYLTQIGSKEKMEEYLNKKMSDIREDMMVTVRNQMIIQQMRSKLTEHIDPTPSEVRRFFAQLPSDSLPTIPTQVEVQILYIAPIITKEEEERIKQQLREYTQRVLSGNADFSMLARLYSEDIESAKKGGELGFVGKGQLVSEFANVAFNLTDPKRVSRIVKTEYGYHIIQLIEKRGDRINCRHILLRPRVSEKDKEKTLTFLDSIREVINNGEQTFERMVAMYSQDKKTAMNAGLMVNDNTGSGFFEFQDLPQEIAKTIQTMNIGHISKPFVMMDEAKNKEICCIVKLKSRTPAHKANVQEDFQVIRNMLIEKLSREFLTKWITKKQQETYIFIDPKWRNCNFEYPNWIHK